jgi:hypothetical protein
LFYIEDDENELEEFMAIVYIPKQNGVDYQCLSTDMSGSAPVDKISWIGANVFVTDTQEWYRVIDDMYLVPLVTPPSSGSITVSISGSDLQIGAVELKDADTDSRAKIVAGSSIVSTDIAIAVRDAGVTSASFVAGGSGVWINDGNIVIDNFPTDYSGSITNIISASLVAGGSIVAIENKNITSNGFLSSVNIGDLTPWMITSSASQVITFAETVNALTIYASASPIYAKINSGSQCIYVAPSNNVALNGQLITEITIMGASPVSLRYHAQYD